MKSDPIIFTPAPEPITRSRFIQSARLLSRSGCLLLSVLLPAAAWSASLGVSEMTGSADSSGCSQPAPVSTFLITDTQATVWFTMNDTASGDRPSAQFIDPKGNLYGSTTWQPGAGGNRCYFASMNIAGAAAAQRIGNWTVKVAFNGSALFT